MITILWSYPELTVFIEVDISIHLRESNGSRPLFVDTSPVFWNESSKHIAFADVLLFLYRQWKNSKTRSLRVQWKYSLRGRALQPRKLSSAAKWKHRRETGVWFMSTYLRVIAAHPNLWIIVNDNKKLSIKRRKKKTLFARFRIFPQTDNVAVDSLQDIVISRAKQFHPFVEKSSPCKNVRV